MWFSCFLNSCLRGYEVRTFEDGKGKERKGKWWVISTHSTAPAVCSPGFVEQDFSSNRAVTALNPSFLLLVRMLHQPK